MKLVAIPAFTDNYIWMLHDKTRALVVDPGDSKPVLNALRRENLQLEAILVTHHHADHVGGIHALRALTEAKVYGPLGEPIPLPYDRVRGQDKIHVLGMTIYILDVPGHTAGHVAYYLEQVPNNLPILFCGDTLFSGGCGRLFEGTPADMLRSLDSLAELPAKTRVCCAHEYTLSNLNFARAVEPDNQDLADYFARCTEMRKLQMNTLPSSIERELKINPFMRSRLPTVSAAARRFDPTANDPVSDFAALREWKNQF